MNRSIAIVAALVGLVVLAPSAAADSGSGDTSAPDPSTPTTEASAPTTETPVTTTETPATTETPVTTTPPATTTVTETPATTVTPSTTAVPVTGTPTTTPTTGTDVPCIADCIPAADDCIGGNCIPSAGGGIPTAVAGAGMLPFTGIEDTIAPILLALTVVLGGVVAWRWAQLRESVARDASTARPIPARDATRTGYAAALRHQFIEQRARQVFTPRVA